MDDSEITIGIVSCGRPSSLKTALKSIKTFVKTPVKVMVIDVTKAYSKDLDMSYCKPMVDKWIEYNQPVGLSDTYQQLADLSDTRYIFYMDDDMYFQYQDVLTAEYEYLKAHPEVGIVGCCWFDKTYNAYREAAMTWLVGYKDGRKCFRKVPISMEYARDSGREMDVVESFEALHGMLIDKEKVFNLGIKWDKNLLAKGDREAFFLNCHNAGVKIHILTNQIMYHNMTPYEYGSVCLKYPGRESKEYFYRTYGFWPLEHWDKNRPRISSDGRHQIIECE